MILKEFNYYLKKGTTLEEIQGSLIKKVNRWCDPFTGCVAHVYDTVLLKHWIVASDNVVGLYKLDKNILLFNDFQMIYDRLDKIEEALPKDDVKEEIIDRLDKIGENLSNTQNGFNDKKDKLSHQEKLKEQLEQEISDLDKKIEEAKARGEDTTELERQKAEKERELATVTQNITNLTNEITNLEQTINSLLGQKGSIEKELEEHKPKELVTKEYVDELKASLDGDIANTKANQDTTYTKTEVDDIANTKANANATVNLTGNQTINGIKTFSVPPVSATNPTTNNQVANKAYVDSVGNTAVKLTSNQTIAGNKTFSGTTTLNGAMVSKGANTFSGNNTFNTGQVTFNNKAPICNVAPAADTNLVNRAYSKKRGGYVAVTGGAINLNNGINFSLNLTTATAITVTNAASNIGQTGEIFIAKGTNISSFQAPFNFRIAQSGFGNNEVFSYTVVSSSLVRIVRS